jgi:hypothetical protein
MPPAQIAKVALVIGLVANSLVCSGRFADCRAHVLCFVVQEGWMDKYESFLY